MASTTSAPLAIAVVGAGVCSDETARIAEEVGRHIARAGALLVCGGMGGVMEAACRGAEDEGGLTIGILPGFNRDSANPYVLVPIATGLGEVRNALIVRTVDAVIAIDGEFGTLSEIALALKIGKPVVGLGTWELMKEGRLDQTVVRATNAQDAATKALSLAQRPVILLQKK
jgi:uncharacterized protein (TIGR00725 family)